MLRRGTRTTRRDRPICPIPDRPFDSFEKSVDGNEFSAIDARRRARYTAAVGGGLGLGRTGYYLLA